MPFPLIILYSIIMHCSCSRFKIGVAELKRRGYTCHMAECILISSDTEKTSSDEELPSFSSILKRKTTRPSSSKNKGAVRDSTATRNNNNRSIEFSSTSNVIELDSPPDVTKCAEPESQSVSEEEELELDPKVAKKRRIEKEKEARRLEREKKKAEKEHEKRVHKMVSQAETEGRKETRPGHRVKQMIVQLETSVTECPKLMKSLLEQLEELEVQYKVEPSLPHHCVMWKRKNTTRCLDQELAKVIENVQEIDEDFLCIIESGTHFLKLVSSSKLMDQTSQSDDETLLQFMQRFAQGRDPKNVVILVNNIDAALRAQKTQRDRIFRAAVRNNKAAHLNTGEVLSYFDCENVMVGLQLETGYSVRLCNSPELVADIIITYTKALADRPFKKEDSFSFHGDLGPGATRKALKEAGDKTGLIWQHQLLQYPGVSTPVASAIITKYPSPSHLLKAYGNCSSQKEAESLLEDIQVRRGAGVIASTRRVGASISKRIHFSMTCKQASELLSNS